jgi:hypothetical protein
MAAKRCPKCGKINPHFFTHCVECGTKLDAGSKKEDKTGDYVKTGIILCVSLILIIFVAGPAIQYSITVSRNLSETVSTEQKDAPVIEYPLDNRVGNNVLQITVDSARDGQNTYNSNKFFIVSISIKNVRTTGNFQVRSSDFELLDSDGNRYYPYGIGSKVTHDLSPSQEINAELTFVIPQKATAKKILFTFQESSGSAINRQVMAFVI